MFSGKKKYIVFVVLIFVAGGWWYWWHGRTPEALWTTEVVKKSDILETVSVVGKFQPVAYADLSFLAIGTIEQVLVEQGSEVKTGDVIALLDTSVLESELKKATVALSIAEQNEMLARRSWDDLGPEEHMVKKLATEQAREMVRAVGTQIRESRLVAPLDGILSSLDARVGETVLAGKVIGRISSPEHFVIKADVPEADIARVTLGKTANVTFDALSADDQFYGVVSSIEPSSTVIQDVIYYTVTFELEQYADNRLREGMSANIDIIISDRKDAVAVPYRAVARDGSKVWVEIAKSETESEVRPITIGVEGDDGLVEVLSGISEGDQVIVSRTK